MTVPLLYLSTDPREAARLTRPEHVPSAVAGAVAMLSCAWHELNPSFLPLDAKPKYPDAFLRRSPPARSRDANPTFGGDHFYKEFSGDKPYWMLGGQRIGNNTYEAHPNCVWARSSRGNYCWVYELGVALAPLTPMLWTLEDAPPHLPPGEPTQPVPLVPEPLVIMDAQGYYDTPASYRNYYRTVGATLAAGF